VIFRGRRDKLAGVINDERAGAAGTDVDAEEFYFQPPATTVSRIEDIVRKTAD